MGMQKSGAGWGIDQGDEPRRNLSAETGNPRLHFKVMREARGPGRSEISWFVYVPKLTADDQHARTGTTAVTGYNMIAAQAIAVATQHFAVLLRVVGVVVLSYVFQRLLRGAYRPYDRARPFLARCSNLCISDPEAIGTIYGHGTRFAKSAWYDAWTAPGGWNLFADRSIRRTQTRDGSCRARTR
ncbi:hypothetical protein NUW58_g5848 [Xylaria curta]|uniref:Uncharacterized protein n=1 Tax=Xylaria curta TaxID=42375 RepID=A0ACC1P0V6_9PEZI|nr:hypothetical protein NUW58_g5848 [Xylaria curta]